MISPLYYTCNDSVVIALVINHSQLVNSYSYDGIAYVILFYILFECPSEYFKSRSHTNFNVEYEILLLTIIYISKRNSHMPFLRST